MAEGSYRCLVSGLAWTTNDTSLRSAFSEFGDFVDASVTRDPETGRSRGFGFVTFGNQQAMENAIEGMNGQTLDGKRITVKVDQSTGGGDGDGDDHGDGSGDGGNDGYSRGYSGGDGDGDGDN